MAIIVSRCVTFFFYLQESPKFGARVVRIRRSKGQLMQRCDIYIGNRICNDQWVLPKSKFFNPFLLSNNSLQRYAKHVRQYLWHHLDRLEGKTLGCWCSDPKRCHGTVLVELLEEKKIAKLGRDIESCGLKVDDEHLVEIREARDWVNDSRFLAYATRLDRTNIFYFQPEIYEAIQIIWGVAGPRCWPAFTNDDKVFWVVGLYDGPQPIGPFWDKNANLKALQESVLGHPSARPNVYGVFEFAKEIQHHLDANKAHFEKALKFALRYHTLHRVLVRCVGNAVGVDMEDRDLTKSRIIHIALAYVDHWGDAPRVKKITKLANSAIVAGHCELENHHPEFGAVDVHKLLVDRVSSHLQKDPTDRENGWGVDLRWIPEAYLGTWEKFKRKNDDIDLYGVGLEKAKFCLQTNAPLDDWDFDSFTFSDVGSVSRMYPEAQVDF